ncbi:MAG: glycogen synthase [Spirochaetes bacterium]|nr:glycogen synthase [Spirochaetota bacterium]
MNILFVAAEMAPFIKSGGLADVVGALPHYLRMRGHDVRVVIPKYRDNDYHGLPLTPVVSPMGVWMGTNQEWCSVLQTVINGVIVYFVEHDAYFNRFGMYHDAGMHDYHDNPHRYGFLCQAALQLCHDVAFTPDLVHAHDWQTAPVCAYLKVWHQNDPLFVNTRSMLTIHNAAYQGVYPAAPHYDYLGLNWENFTPDKFEDHGRLNLLKGGVHFADMVNTVSRTYAHEISRPFGAFGLAPYLSAKAGRFFGIINGVDYRTWSPENDTFIASKFSRKDRSGKKQCKRDLQKRFLLAEDDDVAIIGAVGRFVHQKGYDLLAEKIADIVNNMRVQVVILGTGDPGLERFFGDLPKSFPGRIGSYIGFSNELAHVIEAGSDFFIMPSLYEPCGLNQIYSLRYGTLPIVRATGGLDDTVKNYNEVSAEGNGFKFWDATGTALYYTVGWAISTYYDRPAHMATLIDNAMSEDFSWEKTAAEYETAYRRVLEHQH